MRGAAGITAEERSWGRRADLGEFIVDVIVKINEY
jgi:hypothetical protein